MMGLAQVRNLRDEYNMISSLQGASLFSYENYCKFVENSLKIKQPIIDKMDGNTRLFIKLKNTKAITLESERMFKSEYKKAMKAKLEKIDKNFFQIANILYNSSLLENKHSSGKKMTKVIKETLDEPDIADDMILLYSQIKNSFIVPDSYLVISVEPFDFITMGLGKGWHTCYKPMGDFYTGSYSAGLDPGAFLTYVTTKKDLKFPDDYNNKIYRRLGIFTKDLEGLMLSTQYPYKNDGIEEFTINAITEKFFNESENDVIVEHNQNIKTYKTPLSQVYNDFTSAIKHKRENLYIGNPREGEILRYGKVVKCLRCEKNIASTDMPICVECEKEVFKDWYEGE